MVSGGCLNGGLAGSSRTPAAHNRGGSTYHTQHVCHYQSPSCHLPTPSAARDRDTIVVLPLLFSENEKGELSSSGSTVWLCRLVMRRPFKEGFSCVCVGGAVALVWVGGIQSCRCTVRYKRNWHNWIYYCWCSCPDSINTIHSVDGHFGQCHESARWWRWRRRRWNIPGRSVAANSDITILSILAAM